MTQQTLQSAAAMTRNFDTMHIPVNKDRLPAGSIACLITRNIAKIGAKLLSDLTSTLIPAALAGTIRVANNLRICSTGTRGSVLPST